MPQGSSLHPHLPQLAVVAMVLSSWVQPVDPTGFLNWTDPNGEIIQHTDPLAKPLSTPQHTRTCCFSVCLHAAGENMGDY